ncbi:MMPL family transporter [Rhizomonospora bruguierae]|uniref:MMPL family transporter n=1 Tax=Rhizomonospora bruguierae TaxID=1581705 RepID=UPI0020BE6AC8|nr:MMPL family transporter [Micromonospora sp. NBRC 107566]
MFAALGRFAVRRRWPVIGAWLAVTLAGAVLGGGVYDRVSDVDGLDPAAESAVAQRRIDALLPEGDLILGVVRDVDPYDPALVASVGRAHREIAGMPGVREVADLYSGPGGAIGAGNRGTLVTVRVDPGTDIAPVAAALHRIAAPQVLVGGEVPAKEAFARQALADAALGESVALAALLAALVVILGGLVAGAIPLAVALAAVATALLALSGLTRLTPVSEYSVNVVTLLGIGLAVDYCLLLIARFREEREAGGTLADQVGRTMATAGRTVLISGLAVAVAMAGLAAFATPLLAAMAAGGLIVVALATLLGLTLAPALIAAAHRRIPARRPPRPAQPALLARLAAYAQRRPWPVTLGTGAALLLLALPLTGINLANSDARALPADAEARRAAEVVQRDFRAGRPEPVTALIEADPGTAVGRELLDALNQLPGLAGMRLRLDVPAGFTIVDLTPREASGIPLVRAVRAMHHPAPVLVTGPAAEVVDGRASVAGRLPLVAAVLLVATGILLYALTGSVVVPLKALAMNGLTLLATLGVLVAVFQWGWGGPLLRFDPWGGLDVTTPVLLFVFAFGLTMDYEVFLLARIREEWGRRPGGNTRAVLAGIARTGPVVTAAAVCMVIVFLGFALGRLVAVKEIGVGMAVAVILDVTVVRGLLLPALMTLLGDRNWWPLRPCRCAPCRPRRPCRHRARPPNR